MEVDVRQRYEVIFRHRNFKCEWQAHWIFHDDETLSEIDEEMEAIFAVGKF